MATEIQITACKQVMLLIVNTYANNLHGNFFCVKEDNFAVFTSMIHLLTPMNKQKMCRQSIHVHPGYDSFVSLSKSTELLSFNSVELHAILVNRFVIQSRDTPERSLGTLEEIKRPRVILNGSVAIKPDFHLRRKARRKHKSTYFNVKTR